jgi:hypothetical protein
MQPINGFKIHKFKYIPSVGWGWEEAAGDPPYIVGREKTET